MSQTIAHSLDAKVRTKDIFINPDYNFDSLLLSSPISQGLKDAGFYKPSPIQLKAIPLGRCGLDLIVKAKSGTGKTAVFTIVALEMLKPSENALQVLIFAPTREIAVQIHDVIQTIGKECKNLHVSLFIGGLSLEKDVEKAKSCNIAVGAPGRLKHLIEKGYLDTSSVRLVVFDEADKLMEKCFQNDINYVFHKLPDRKQIMAISASYPHELNEFLTRYMVSPTFVTPEDDNCILLGLRQFVTIIKSNSNIAQLMKSKTEELVSLLSKISFTQCLVFCNFQQRTESISNLLNRKGWNSTYISAAQTQLEHLKSCDSLKKFECRILLSTDLTARGIDAANVDLVINYDVPHEAATYLHRMGRAGRYGSRGLCITIAGDGKELKLMQSILGEIGGSELNIARLPSGQDLTEDLWVSNLDSFEKVSGIVDIGKDDQNKKLSLKTSVLELKDTKKNRNETDSVSTDVKKLSMEEDAPGGSHLELESIKNFLGNNQEIPSDQYSEINSECLLKSLAVGKSFASAKDENCLTEETINSELKCLLPGSSQAMEKVKKRKKMEEIVNPALMYPWVPVEVPVLSMSSNAINLLDLCDTSQNSDEEEFMARNTDTKKRKRKQSFMVKATGPANKGEESKQNILCKNTALCSNERWTQAHEHEEPSETVDCEENIFKLVYDTQLWDAVHWTVALGDKYVEEESEEEEFMARNTDTKKRKRKQSFVVKATGPANKGEESKQNILCKNTALCSNEQWTQAQEHEEPSETVDCEENIFKLVYDTQLWDAVHWTVALGDKYVEEESEEEEMEVEVEQADGYEDGMECPTDYRSRSRAPHMSTNESQHEAKNNYSSYDNAVWTSDAPSGTVAGYYNEDYFQNDKFASYFDHYNQQLANDALTFEDVHSFDGWFEQWQMQVASLRDHVQQNLYIQEMNNYRQNRNYFDYSYDSSSSKHN